MEKEMKFEQIENILNHVKGSFSTEQFGVFLNMYSSEIEDNYPVRGRYKDRAAACQRKEMLGVN